MLISLPPPYPLFCPPRPHLACSTPTSCVLRPLAAPRARDEPNTIDWYPLYAYIRRRGYTADEAGDLTQEFFARLLESDFFGAADPAKGRFRAFLLASCKNFLANEHDRAGAQKRGGGRSPVTIYIENAEGRYSREPSHDLTAEKLFERQWAVTLLDHALARLRKQPQASGDST